VLCSLKEVGQTRVCAFPIAVLIRTKRLYRPCHLNHSVLRWGIDTYVWPRGLLKPDEDEKERTCALSQSPSISAWSGSTGRVSYTAFNVRYMGLQMCSLLAITFGTMSPLAFSIVESKAEFGIYQQSKNSDKAEFLET
jgi:hypothetical protein